MDREIAARPTDVMPSKISRDVNALPTLKWAGTAAGVSGALLLAAHIPLSAWGWALFLVHSTCWLAAGSMMRDRPLILLNGTFTAVNVLGCARWLF